MSRMQSLQELFEKQKSHHPRLREKPLSYRIQKLRDLKRVVLEEAPGLHDALFKDFRKSAEEVDISELYPTAAEIEFTIKHIKRWAKPQRVPTPLVFTGSRCELRFEPKGVVLIIGPFNYPFQLLLAPLISAIAAGNCAIVKPSELTPNTAKFIEKVLGRVFPPEEIAVVQGDAQTAQELLSLRFDHIMFTGSPRVGKVVMQAAAKNLIPVTLELGGKSPVIIDATANIGQAAERTVWGKYFNGGQTCIAPDYVLVHRSKEREFIEAAKKAMTRLYGSTDEDRRQSPDLCRIVNANHFQRIRKLIEESIAAGAKLEAGGQFDEGERYISPTILSQVPESSPIMQHEIFGPVLPVIAFDTLEETAKLINQREKPLALYIFSQDRAKTDWVIHNTSAGGTCINNTMIHFGTPTLPFGGVGESGIGSYHGLWGFKTFSHERAVLIQGPIDPLKWVYPPFRSRARKVIALMLRFLT